MSVWLTIGILLFVLVVLAGLLTKFLIELTNYLKK